MSMPAAFGQTAASSAVRVAAPAPPLQVQAPKGAPNVVVVLLDDVGFAASSTFGGPAETPVLDALAREGLRYNRFHTTGICSPTRAALLSGRNAHAVGIGAVMNSADERPGYQGVHARDAATMAEILRDNGYNTAAFGKWHQTPDWEISQSGPFDRWPTGQGFEKFYGFLGGETDQFEPTLIEGTTPVMRPAGKGYHLTEDLANRAIAWMRVQHSVTPEKPFFLYFAPGATHAPLQAPGEWIEKYRGRFEQGWDRLREEILARQKELGVVPKGTVLTPRPEGLPAWEALGADDKKIASRLMEVYAGFLAHTDAQVGRIVQALKEAGEFDNTLFVYIVGDNGGSAEGGMLGSLNYMGAIQGLQEDRAQMLGRLESFGGPATYPHYPAAWAWAMDTPFQWTKSVASHLGGTRNPMVITWPKRIHDHGGLRSQFGHVNDILPTVLEAAGLDAPAVFQGIRQKPLDGTSLVYSFADAKAPERHTTQYFEIFGHRAIYHEGWMASAFHARLPWQVISMSQKPFESDRWELYDLRRDFSQAHDLAAKEPERLEALQALFMQEAERNQVLPLKGQVLNAKLPSLTGGRTEFTYYSGAVGIPEKGAPPIFNRSWSVSATIEVPGSEARGVIAAMGGAPAGWSLYLDSEGKPAFHYRAFEAGSIELAGGKPLGAGRHVVQVDFDYDGGGFGKGGTARLTLDGEPQGEGRVATTPPAYFSINETFDIGLDTGSAAGRYPSDAAPGYPFSGGRIERVDVRLRAATVGRL
ncbi:MAG: arylsulfatase [Gammaproteobacteria bacterium]|nr:arylsulfatase [Gammaproteobacteria bacterium]